MTEERIEFEDGSVYVGEVKDGAPHGRGTITWPDGGKAEGEFKDDKLVRGTVTWPDGQTFEGELNDAELVRGTLTWPDGETCRW